MLHRSEGRNISRFAPSSAGSQAGGIHCVRISERRFNAIVGKPTAITNFSHCAVADAPINAARIETDPQKQLADWSEAQRLIHQELCAVPLFNLRQVWLRSDRLDYGYELDGAMNLAPPITELTQLKTE